MRIGGVEVQRVHEDGHRRIELVGELDLADADAIRTAILEDDTGKALVIDTIDLAFVDSSGLRALIAAREHYGQRLTLVAGERTHRILEVSGLLDYFGLKGAHREGFVAR